MINRTLRTSAALGALLALVAAGCATGKSQMASSDPIADRQRVMKNQGANWADIQAKVKANNIEGIAVNAENLALSAKQITALFPEGVTGKTAAKPEIWQKWSEFEAAAKNLETRSAELRDAVRAKDGDKVQAIVKDFGRNACGTCHTPFRVPPPPAAPAQPAR
ncbi:MAG: cytochrome c [Candidatus Rokubacteria bacterium]|nr:cytochrome c [Candidatus Rokubacteria bacterium]